MDAQLKEAVSAIRAGNKTKAYQLLAEIIRNAPQNVRAWFMLSHVVEQKERQIECLQQVVNLSPNHPEAKRLLEQLGVIPQSSPSTFLTPLDDLVEQWFSVLNYREQKVLEYLFLDPNRFSMAAVGRIVSVPRQKVVEIRQRAIRKLREPNAYSTVEPLVTLLFTIMREVGKSISESQLDAALRRELVVGQIDPLGVAKLIFALEKDVATYKNRQVNGRSAKPSNRTIARPANERDDNNPKPDRIDTHVSESGTTSGSTGAKSGPIGSVSLKYTEMLVSEKSERPYLTSGQTQPIKGSALQETTQADTPKTIPSHKKNVFLQDDKTLIKALGLSRRIYNALFRGGVQTIGQLTSLSAEKLLALRNIGENSLAEIEMRLDVYLTEVPHLLIQNNKPESLLDESPVEIQENSQLVKNDFPIALLGLSTRSYNALMRAGITTISQLNSLSDTQLLNVNNVGFKSAKKIKVKLETFLAKTPNLIESHPVLEEINFQSSLALELLDHTATIPIDEISIRRLDLPPIVTTSLNQQGIETIGQLIQHADEIVDDGNIGEPLNRYLVWLIEQDETVWADEIANKGISPLFRLALADTTLEVMINSWLAPLTEREQDVINTRFGLYGEKLTLKELGEQLSVTRERVRQIQKKSLRKLKNRYPIQKKEYLRPLLAYFHQLIIEHGGLLGQSEIITILESEDIVPLGNANPMGMFSLLSEMDEQVHYFKKQNFVALSEYSADAITSVQACFTEILEREITPVPNDVLLMEFKKTNVYTSYKEWRTQYPDDFFVACLRVHPKIEQLDSGLYTLARWSKKRLGAIVTALREIGEPAHYSVITEKTNELLPPDQRFTVRAIHARLGQYPDLFVWVRLRGTYGLKEWGLERELSYADALAQILENTGYPLTIDQVLARLPKVRQFYDESSVIITLGTHERFHTFSNNTYGLVEWTTERSKADFVDLFGNQLARRQAELDRQRGNTEIDTQQEVDTIRNMGLDFFSD